VFTLGPTTQATLVKVKWRRRIWREWDGEKKKKIKKFPIFFPQNKSKESYRRKDFFFYYYYYFGICAKLHTKDKKNKIRLYRVLAKVEILIPS